ncbi:hypothetical protein B296_00024086 [Ensete ventricosum]|uniref:Uncharacterized protein n=1 Tax=Ensete ventricosum TaxID=4639 RepID=A0A426XS60_ENSVE|nr:hypothetical protein B296_00024086 [Ensete ventricosum]
MLIFVLVIQVRAAMEKYPPYQSIFAKISYGESQMLDKAFYEEEVKRLCLAFEQQVIINSSLFNLCLDAVITVILGTPIRNTSDIGSSRTLEDCNFIGTTVVALL